MTALSEVRNNLLRLARDDASLSLKSAPLNEVTDRIEAARNGLNTIESTLKITLELLENSSARQLRCDDMHCLLEAFQNRIATHMRELDNIF